MFTHLIPLDSVSWCTMLPAIAGMAVLDARRNRRGVTWGAAFALLVAAVLFTALAMVQVQQGFSAIPQQSISFPATALRGSITVSPDGEHIAFVNVINGRHIAVVDGKADQPSMRILLQVQPASRYMGHTVPTSNPALSQHNESFFFSPDSRTVAYVAEPTSLPRQNSRQVVVVAGERRGSYNFYDEVDAPLFSPDGKHMAYSARRGNTWVVEQDRRESRGYAEVGLRGPARMQHNEDGDRLISGIAPVFSPDSQRLAFGAWNSKGWVVVVNGQEGKPYDAIGDLTFSPDSKHLAYVARRDGNAYLVFDGQESPAYGDVRYPTFSPDGKRFAYAAQRGYAGLLICDGQEHKTNSDISPIVVDRPIFSPDSAHVAVSATLGGADTPRSIIIDGAVVTPTFVKVGEPIFSPDSRYIAYTARRYPEKAYLVLAAVPVTATELEVRAQQEIPNGTDPVFSPDGTRFAYVVSEAGVSRVVSDGKTLPSVFVPIQSMTFSPRGDIVYCTQEAYKRAGSGCTRVYVNGVTSAEYDYDALLSVGNNARRFFFDAPDRFHYFALTEGAIERVEVTIPAAGAQSMATQATDAGISLKASVLAAGGSVTAYEPVLVKVEETNESAETVTLPSGSATEWTTRVLIEDARGRILATSPRARLPLNFMYGILRLPPGGSAVRVLAVSALYPFATPGTYTVRVQRLKLQDEIAVLAESRATVRVLPFDAARLAARCKALFTYQQGAQADRDLSMHDQQRALLSVRHDIVLPYLDWLARNPGTTYEACSAMRLLGTPRALSELNTLAARRDRVGKTARNVLETPIDRIIWTILGDPDAVVPRETR